MNFQIALLLTIPFYFIACWLFLPKEQASALFNLKNGWRFGFGRMFAEWAPVALLFTMLGLQIAEVYFDQAFTGIANRLFGGEVVLTSFFQHTEGNFWSAVFGAIDASDSLENAVSKYLSVVYIVIHPIMIGFVPLLLLFSGSRLFKGIAASYLSMYAISLPFYLFLPVTNVFTSYSRETALLVVFDGIKENWYKATTENNCFPSLHTAMVVIVVAFAYYYWKEGKGRYGREFFIINLIYALSVIFGVIFLTIHWIADVVGGLIVAAIAIYFGIRYSGYNEAKPRGNPEKSA
jgi:membrane-associated phospholipid phosphatase